MSKILLTGPASDPDDGIVDAEFEEIAENGAPTQAQASRPPDYTIREWWGDMHPAKKAIGIVGALLVLIPFALYKPNGLSSTPDLLNTTDPSTTAEKMLSEWTRYVTGEPKPMLTLVNGDGLPGSNCSDGNPNRLIMFGGRVNPTQTGGARPDDFTILDPATNAGVEGRFWWDTQTNVIVVQDFHTPGDPARTKTTVPAKTLTVGKLRFNFVELDGISYHVCEQSDEAGSRAQ